MNLQPIQQESTCHYLFGKEASEIFKSPDFKNFSEDFLNQSLDILMRVNVAFLSKKENDGFCFIDPVAGNNQCHLYALFASRIKKDYKQKTLEEKLARTQENRFLHLSFFLSYAFKNERPLFCNVIEKAANGGEVHLPSTKKEKDAFISFLKKTNVIVTAAREALNVVFKQHIEKLFEANQERSALHRELCQLSLENLTHPSELNGTSLYTLPKLAGVAYLVNEAVALVIKTKVITSQGTGTLVYHNRTIKEDEPVLVFEAMTSDEFSINELREIAKKCPTFFERHASRKNRHPENQTCSFCHSKQLDLQLYQERFKKATTVVSETLYASAADFVREFQSPFKQFLQNKEKYPLLTHIFQEAIPNIDKLEVSMKKPSAFTIHHVHVDDGKHALSSELRIQSSPETYLKARGFL